jgi:hypothetical protein
VTDITVIIGAASAIGGALGAMGATAILRDTTRKLRNGIACRDRKLSESETIEKQLRGWLDERDTKIVKQEKEIQRLATGWNTAGDLANELLSERDEARRLLALAGKPDQQAVSDWARKMQKRSVEAQNRKRALQAMVAMDEQFASEMSPADADAYMHGSTPAKRASVGAGV